MGLMRDQAIRLLRDDWGGGGTKQLAEELYSMLTGDDPIQVDSPMSITVKGNRNYAPLTVNNFTGSQFAIDITNGGFNIGDQTVDLGGNQFGGTTAIFEGNTIGAVTTNIEGTILPGNVFGDIVQAPINFGDFTINDGMTLGGGNISITNQGARFPPDVSINQGGAEGTQTQTSDCTGGGSSSSGYCGEDIVPPD